MKHTKTQGQETGLASLLDGTTPNKKQMYRTARATIACAYFKAGDFVAVEHYTNRDGKDWFKVFNDRSERDGITIVYPEHHLTNFVL